MATDTGRTFGFDDLYTRAGDTGFGDYGITGRKRKTYDRGFDIDTDQRRRGSRFGFGGGYGGTAFDRDFGLGRPSDYWPYDYGTLAGPMDYGRGTYEDVGYPYTFFSGRYGFPQPSQAIGEAGYDLGISGRRAADERRYRRLRDWNRVEENPNIDDVTLWRPRADVLDQDTGLRVEFELPGVPREDISLMVKDDVITLAALKPQSRKEEAGFHYQNERHFGKFYRRLALPFMIDPASVRAYLEMGVLKVHLNRAGGTERIAITEERVPIGAPGSTTGAGTRETVGAAGSIGTTTSGART